MKGLKFKVSDSKLKEEFKRQEYINSFKYANIDKETLLIAEEGIAEYKKMLEK